FSCFSVSMRESTASTASRGETFFFAISAARSDADIQQRSLSFMALAIVCCPGHRGNPTAWCVRTPGSLRGVAPSAEQTHGDVVGMKLALSQGLSGVSSLSGDIAQVLEAELAL